MKTKRMAHALLFLAVLFAMLIPAMGQGKDDAWACINNIEEHSAFVFSPDGAMLASVSEGKGVVTLLQNVSTRKVIREFSGGSHVAFLPDGKTLVSANSGAVRLWSVETGEELREFDVQIGVYLGEARGNRVALSPDGRMVAAGNDEEVRLWDVVTGKNRGKFGMPKKPGALPVPPAARVFAFSPDGQTLFTGQAFWAVNSMKELSWFAGNAETVRGANFSPDGKILATTEEDSMATNERNSRVIRLWDVATGREVRRLEGHQQKVPPFAFYPDGKTLVSGDFALLRFWDVASGKERSKVDMREEVANLAFSPDGRMLALGHYRIKFWKVTMEQLPDSLKVEVMEEPGQPEERAKTEAETNKPSGLGKKPLC